MWIQVFVYTYCTIRSNEVFFLFGIESKMFLDDVTMDKNIGSGRENIDFKKKLIKTAKNDNCHGTKKKEEKNRKICNKKLTNLHVIR